MATFKLVAGRHHDPNTGKTYHKGELVQSDLDLCALHVNKFERQHTRRDALLAQTRREEAERAAEAAKKTPLAEPDEEELEEEEGEVTPGEDEDPTAQGPEEGKGEPEGVPQGEPNPDSPQKPKAAPKKAAKPAVPKKKAADW